MEASATQYDELKAAVDGLVGSVNDAKGRVTVHLTNLDSHVAALEAQIASGAAPDLTALKDEIVGAKGAVDSIDPAAALPAPAPPVEGSPAEEAGEAPAAEATEDAPPAGEPPAPPPPPDPAPA